MLNAVIVAASLIGQPPVTDTTRKSDAKPIIVWETCLVANSRNGSPISRLHKEAIPTDGSRLEYYVVEIKSATSRDGKPRTVMNMAIIAIEGPRSQLVAFEKWINQNARLAGVDGVESTLKLVRDLLGNTTKSVHICLSVLSQYERPISMAEFISKREYAANLESPLEHSNLSPNDWANADQQIRKRILGAVKRELRLQFPDEVKGP